MEVDTGVDVACAITVEGAAARKQATMLERA